LKVRLENFQALHKEMRESGVDALWICGDLRNNPDMVYFTGIHHVIDADLFLKVDEEPVLYHRVTMESEEAALSGLNTTPYFLDRPLNDYLDANNGDLLRAYADRICEALREIELTEGRIALSGSGKIARLYALVNLVNEQFPALDIQCFLDGGPLAKSRMLKSNSEIDRIKKIGGITTEVMGRVQEYISRKFESKGKLLHEDRSPVLIGDVKKQIQLWLAELGADNPEDTIFSIGRDGGVPHNTGNPDDVLRTGVPIVFDIFPCESGGGYFYDITRTWSIGYAADEALAVYEQVLDVHHRLITELKAGVHFRQIQKRTCQLFAELGHPTICGDKTTTSGYCHSIGHGVGLNIHEKPFSGATTAKDDFLNPGVVFTIEPGLYYPEKGFGVRVEDTLYLNEHGVFEILAEYPYDHVIPVKKSI